MVNRVKERRQSSQEKASIVIGHSSIGRGTGKLRGQKIVKRQMQERIVVNRYSWSVKRKQLERNLALVHSIDA